jgi:hypothetical protein
MLYLTEFKSAQNSWEYITLIWKLESSPEDFNDYRLYIYRSQLPSTNLNDFALLSSGINPANDYEYHDQDIYGITSKFIEYYYLLQISGLSAQGESYSQPIHLYLEQDKYAREIQRRRNLILDYHSGESVRLLKRREYGTFCPVCYDETLQRITKSGCLTCYDTGYLGGYYSPLDMRVQMSERPVREMHQMFSQWQDADATLFSKEDPVLAPNDIIIDKRHRFWMVVTSGTAKKGEAPFARISQIRQVEKANVIYEYPTQ